MDRIAPQWSVMNKETSGFGGPQVDVFFISVIDSMESTSLPVPPQAVVMAIAEPSLLCTGFTGSVSTPAVFIFIQYLYCCL